MLKIGRIMLTLLGYVLVPVVYSESELQPMCSSLPTSSMHLSVASLRSQKGNWVTTVDLKRGGGRGLPDWMRTEPWTVDVDSNTRTCEGAESTLHVTLTLTAPLPEVGSDYELFPGLGYYKFHNNVTTWELARQTCAEEGAHLAIINSEKESDVMKILFARFSITPGSADQNLAWIGFKRIGDGFFTIAGDALNTTGFMRWEPGEPNEKGYICGYVDRTNGGMGDGSCGSKLAFVCEYPL